MNDWVKIVFVKVNKFDQNVLLEIKKNSTLLVHVKSWRCLLFNIWVIETTYLKGVSNQVI